MQLNNREDDALQLSLNERELRLIMACIAESFSAIDRREYALRIGAPIEEVSALAKELKGIMEKAGIEL